MMTVRVFPTFDRISAQDLIPGALFRIRNAWYLCISARRTPFVVKLIVLCCNSKLRNMSFNLQSFLEYNVFRLAP